MAIGWGNFLPVLRFRFGREVRGSGVRGVDSVVATRVVAGVVEGFVVGAVAVRQVVCLRN